MSPLAPRLALKATVLYFPIVFLPPATLSLRGRLYLWSPPRRRRLSCVVASCCDLIVCSNAASAVSPSPRAPTVRGPSPSFAILLRRWRSVCDGLARAFRARASLAALPRLSPSRPPTPSQGQGFVLSWAAPLLCFGVAPVSSLCRGYYSYSRLLSDSVFEGVGVRLYESLGRDPR